MNIPIIVYQPGDPMIFGSAAAASSHLEPIDVKNDEYVAYDSEGRLLALRAKTFSIIIERAEEEPTHTGEVRAILTELLSNENTDKDWLREASIEELVRKALEYKTS